MEIAKVHISGTEARTICCKPITRGIIGAKVAVEYDEELWAGLTKKVVFTNGLRTVELLNPGDQVVLPPEVVDTVGKNVSVGVCGTNADGKLVIPTLWTVLSWVCNAVPVEADEAVEPTPPVWAQLLVMIGSLENLKTKAKDNLVAAVNELAARGGDADPAEIQRIVEEYLAANMPEVELPATLPNPHPLRLTGAVEATYDGSVPVEVVIPQGGDSVKPVAKTDDMTQPVGMDENGQLWTAPTAEAEEPDILLGTLPMTISESNCYLLSETDATISTGGAEQLLDFDVSEPYIGATTYNGGAFEKIEKNMLKVSFANTERNAVVYFPLSLHIGKNYTAVARVVEHSADIAENTAVIVRFVIGQSAYAQLSPNCNGAFAFKTFDMREGANAYISLTTNSAYVVGETYVTVEVRIYEGEHTEIPSGASFDILPGEKYNTDGYIGSTLTAVNGETVSVYKTNTNEAETETDTGGIIFFGDSILDHSGVPKLYAAKTGKAVLDCAVGGTRMSGSRDNANEYYPYDMANIADAIASGDFSAQTSGGKNANFTVLASANIANYKAIVLEFGTNDFTAKVPFDGTDATSIKGALKHILTSILTKYPNMRIVVLSTLQYVTIGNGTESGVPTHDNGTVWQMNEVIKGVCESDEFCVPFVDMYHAFGQNAITRNTLNSDGVHLALPSGAKRYANILTAKLNGLGI